MALSRTPEPSGRLNPRDSVAAYSASVLGAGASGQPLPRTVMQTTTPKVPYPAKSGSGTYMPTTGGSGVFDIVNQSSQATHKRAAVQGKRSLTTSRGGGGGGGGNYKTATAKGHGGAYGLRPEAGSRLVALQGAYRKQFGSDLPINSGGRSYAEQAKLYADYRAGRGNLAAPPGTSNHESGNAVDFGGAAHGYSAQHTWLVNNAPNFGWYWAGKNFSQVEPWHFEAMY